MKGITIAAIVVIIAGLYLEYTKDSSFQSVDSGSILIGIGGGMLLHGAIA